MVSASHPITEITVDGVWPMSGQADRDLGGSPSKATGAEAPRPTVAGRPCRGAAPPSQPVRRGRWPPRASSRNIWPCRGGSRPLKSTAGRSPVRVRRSCVIGNATELVACLPPKPAVRVRAVAVSSVVSGSQSAGHWGPARAAEPAPRLSLPLRPRTNDVGGRWLTRREQVLRASRP